MNKTLLQIIADFIFGTKYYVNIVNTYGTQKLEMCSYIFHTKAEAEQHQKNIKETITFRYIETVSFRSRNEY